MRFIMTTNNGILIELQELEKSGDLPQKVSNRLLLAGIIKNTESISTLAAKESKNDKKIGTLEKIVTLLSGIVMAILGWTVFG